MTKLAGLLGIKKKPPIAPKLNPIVAPKFEPEPPVIKDDESYLTESVLSMQIGSDLPPIVD